MGMNGTLEILDLLCCYMPAYRYALNLELSAVVDLDLLCGTYPYGGYMSCIPLTKKQKKI